MYCFSNILCFCGFSVYAMFFGITNLPTNSGTFWFKFSPFSFRDNTSRRSVLTNEKDLGVFRSFVTHSLESLEETNFHCFSPFFFRALSFRLYSCLFPVNVVVMVKDCEFYSSIHRITFTKEWKTSKLPVW